jgi:hypothetical protein
VEAASILAAAKPIDDRRGASRAPLAPFGALLPDGSVTEVGVPDAHRLLLLFLSLNCDGCRDLFAASKDPTSFGLESGDQVLVVVREVEDEVRLRLLLDGATGVSSTEAFETYRVAGAPFFVLLDPRYATVATEGVAWGVASVLSAVAATMAGTPAVEVDRLDEPRP